MSNKFLPGNLVKARNRTWVVQSGSTDEWLRLRPMGGADDEVTELMPTLEQERVTLAQFEYPDATRVGPFGSARLLYDALRFQLRSGAGPFRSFGSIAVEPRSYQLVPLMMAMRQKVVRLLIADDVGIGKTIEAGLIVREMMDRGEIEHIAVLCPPHLIEQWVSELSEHFNIEATALTSSSAARLEKRVPHGKTMIDTFPVLVVSLDYIKSEKHRDYFQTMNFDMIIVDEAHTCVKTGGMRSKQLRFDLLKKLSQQEDRHMVLLTATPHSGNEEGFYNLLSILDEKFLALQHRQVNARDSLRMELAKHFVQRRRQDIAEWRVSDDERMTGFPRRKTTEKTYRLTNEWDAFFTAVQDYCQDIVGKNNGENRLIWYAVLSLFRCISSSPAAAVQALNNRLKNQDEKVIEDEESEYDNLDENNDSDIEPALYLEETQKLEDLLEKARQLGVLGNDPKVATLVKHIKELIKDGYQPVVFCRYVATADYVAKALKAAFKKVTVECVTGELVPDERKARVEALGEAPERILVATDCLSEGINLQQHFTAVVHYDLAWNPTRHEQREGRVDRFGQKAKEVRCTQIYGENNPVDGFILRVILKKSQTIKESLGVIVPVPEKKAAIDQALIRAALFKNRNEVQDQMELFVDDEVMAWVETVWDDAMEKVKKNRTVFAQQAIHPEAVYPLWQEQQEVLGSHADLESFGRNACATLGCHLNPVANSHQIPLYRFPVSTIKNESIRERFYDEGYENDEVIDFDALHRSSAFINILSEGVVESAIKGDTLISRCGVGETDAVTAVTRLYLLRFRYQIRLTYRNQTRRYMLSEEILPVVVTGSKDPKWVFGEEARKLFAANVGGNFNAQFAEKQVSKAIDFIRDQQEALKDFAQNRADALLKDHQKVKEFTSDGWAQEVSPCLPVDVMGVYVLLPSDDE